jgi:hypothetical protein
MSTSNSIIYLVYFQGPDYFLERYFVDFNKAKEYYASQIKEHSDETHGDAWYDEKTLALIGINDGDTIGSGTYGELYANNIIEQFEFEEQN